MAIGSPVYVYRFRLREKSSYENGQPDFAVNTYTIIGENDNREQAIALLTTSSPKRGRRRAR